MEADGVSPAVGTANTAGDPSFDAAIEEAIVLAGAAVVMTAVFPVFMETISVDDK